MQVYKVRRIAKAEQVIRVPATVSGYYSLTVEKNGDLIYKKLG